MAFYATTDAPRHREQKSSALRTSHIPHAQEQHALRLNARQRSVLGAHVGSVTDVKRESGCRVVLYCVPPSSRGISVTRLASAATASFVTSAILDSLTRTVWTAALF